jgi:hypothetical protein
MALQYGHQLWDSVFTHRNTGYDMQICVNFYVVVIILNATLYYRSLQNVAVKHL